MNLMSALTITVLFCALGAATPRQHTPPPPPAAADGAPTAAEIPSDRLGEFDAFLGKTWVAEGEIRGMGKYSGEYTFQKTLDGKFIERKGRLTVKQRTHEETTMIGMSPDVSSIVLWTFASEGMVTRSIEGPGSVKGAWIFLVIPDGSDETDSETRMIISDPKDGTFTTQLQMFRDEVWTTTMSIEYSARP